MIIYGKNPVLEALKAGITLNKILVASGYHFDNRLKEIIRIARERKIVFLEVNRHKLDELSQSKNHQGVIAFVSPKKYVDAEDILNQAKSLKQSPFILILDQIEDPHNLGAVIRTAEAVGIHGIIIPKHHASPVTETVAKVSSGAIEHVNIAVVTNLASAIEDLKKEEIKVIGLEAGAQNSYLKQNYNGPLAFVLGSEGRGLRRLTKEKCDFLVSIPMIGKIPSLNVSVAAGIVLYEAFRQRTI